MSEIVIVVTGQTGPSGGAGTTALDDLTDVTITAAASGDILRHNGTAWVDAVGTTFFEAAGAVAAHAAAADPHPTYTTAAELTSALTPYLTSAAAPELIRDTIGTALVAGSNITITVNDAADTITIASTATGGAGPQWAVTGNTDGLYPHGHSATNNYSASAGLSSANSTLWFPFYVDRAVTLNRIIMNVFTASATATARLGVYTASAPDVASLTGTLVADLGTISAATGGRKEATGSAALSPGWHAICAAFNSDATVRWRWGGGGGPYGHNDAYNQFNVGWRESGIDRTGGLPASIPAGASLSRSGVWPAGVWFTYA